MSSASATAASRELGAESPVAVDAGQGDEERLAPTSGSGLDLEGGAAAPAAVAAAVKDGVGIVVKRGGNPRWLSPTTDLITPGGGAEVGKITVAGC